VTASAAFILLTIGVLISLQFYRGRRQNLRLMRDIARELEEAVRPRDQTYTWLGGYVGFRADYKIATPLSNQVQATLTLLPRQSILHFPFSLLFLRHDRLYLLIKLRRPPPGEAHAVSRRYYRFGPGIEGRERMFREERKTPRGPVFELWYRHSPARESLVWLLDRLEVPGLIKHLALVPGVNHIYCLMQPVPGKISAVVRTLLSLSW